jgi:hypothetical protein
MKISTKSIVLFVLAALSLNAQAMKVSLEVDPSLLVPENTFAIDAQIYNCNNQPVCTFEQESSSEIKFLFDYDKILYVTPRLFAAYGLPAHSNLDAADSYIRMDIIKDGAKTNLPGCFKIVNGMNSVNISMTPSGCVIS